PSHRKSALSIDDVVGVVSKLESSTSHDDRLFLAMLVSSFFGLMRLGELAKPDNPPLHNPKKFSRRTSISITSSQFSFFLPAHKADPFFEGNRILISNQVAISTLLDPIPLIARYLASRDVLFPFSSELWLASDGSPPNRSFFISRLRRFFGPEIAGQSLRAGGATWLAEQGVPPHVIQAIGRWASSTFQIYIRKHPILAHLFVHPQTN
ncbi:hypothetical protein BDN72DRAFT_777349, partial [Pluteus cervinus]